MTANERGDQRTGLYISSVFHFAQFTAQGIMESVSGCGLSVGGPMLFSNNVGTLTVLYTADTLTELLGYTKDIENVYAPLMMMSIWGWKRTLATKIVYENESINTSFNISLFSIDSTFKSIMVSHPKISQYYV
jgi:hypothetical protein